MNFYILNILTNNMDVNFATKYNEVYEFVKQSTKDFDESHDIKHALKVYENALEIVDRDYINDNLDKEIIMYAAMLHDVCDHKYPNSIKLNDLNHFIYDKLEHDKAKIVIEIIDNISYSKEEAGNRKDVHHPYLNIISDADKLEAIGLVGINRCYAFNKAKYPHLDDIGIKKGVISHCTGKLLKLKDQYIRTNAGKTMAIPLHEEIVEWMANLTIDMN